MTEGWSDLLLAIGVIFLGGTLQGTLGFGLALIAAPVLVFLNDDWVPGPLLLAGWPFMALLVWRERTNLDLRASAAPWIGLTVGVALGVVLLLFVDAKWVSILVASIILGAVLLSLFGWSLPLNLWTRLFGGTLAGFTGATSSVPGPALALLHQNASPQQMRAALAPFFLLGSTLALVGLIVSGQMNRVDFEVGLWLMPPALLGFVVSGYTAAYVRSSVVRPAVLVFAAVAALGLLVRSLVR